MDKLKNILYIIGALIAIAGSVYGATEFFAKKTELKLVASRLDQKIANDDAKSLQNRIWQYDDRFGEGCSRCNPEQKARYRQWLKDLEKLEEYLKELRKQQMGG